MSGTVIEPLAINERQAAKMLSISPSQLAKMRYRGEIQAAVLGRKCVRYTLEEIHSFLTRKQSTARANP